MVFQAFAMHEELLWFPQRLDCQELSVTLSRFDRATAPFFDQPWIVYYPLVN